MSLWTASKTACTMRVRTPAKDMSGGFTGGWSDGDTFYAAFAKGNSNQERIAAIQGVAAPYNVFTDRTVVLHYHDVFRRDSDGKIFRVTSEGTDRATPASAGISMRRVTAEEWHE